MCHVYSCQESQISSGGLSVEAGCFLVMCSILRVFAGDFLELRPDRTARAEYPQDSVCHHAFRGWWDFQFHRVWDFWNLLAICSILRVFAGVFLELRPI